MPLKALQWLCEENGPLRFRPEADLRQWRWLARFLANCNAGANRKTIVRLLALGELSRRAMAERAVVLPLDEFAWRDAGKMVVYRSKKAFDAAVARLGAHDALAAGIQSRDLAASASLYLPLYARIGDALRVTAMVDMVGGDTAIDARRIAGLLRRVRATMPYGADFSSITPWAGLRPATPDGAPIIGAARYANLWLNVSHGPLGFTFACGSAKWLAGCMKGEALPFALDGLTLR